MLSFAASSQVLAYGLVFLILARTLLPRLFQL
jgi:hypothetical protein